MRALKLRVVLSNPLRVTEMVNERARIQIQAIWLQTQHSYLLDCIAFLCTFTMCPKLYQTDTKKVCGNNKVKSNGYPWRQEAILRWHRHISV